MAAALPRDSRSVVKPSTETGELSPRTFCIFRRELSVTRRGVTDSASPGCGYRSRARELCGQNVTRTPS